MRTHWRTEMQIDRQTGMDCFRFLHKQESPSFRNSGRLSIRSSVTYVDKLEIVLTDAFLAAVYKAEKKQLYRNKGYFCIFIS